jgi:hypothetical protein
MEDYNLLILLVLRSMYLGSVKLRLEMLSETLKSVKQPDDIDIAIIERQIAEDYALIEDMQKWLDKFLKN